MKKYHLFIFIIFSVSLLSQTKTFIREYTYSAGEADSKITSRTIALEQVKRILLEEIGVYLQSEMTTTKEEKNEVYNELTKQQIQSITAGITETKILEEKWSGDKYYIKASISVDPDEVNKNIVRIGADQSKLKELLDVKRKADEAFDEIERLRKELASAKSEYDKLAKQKEYNTASNILSASDWFLKGYNASKMKDWDNAILCFQKAIELNPCTDGAYSNLGVANYNKGNFDKAIQLYEKVIELNPKFPEVYYNLGVVYKIKGNIDIAIQFYEKAIELNPKLAEAHLNLGNIYRTKGNFDKAIRLYEKAIELDPQLYQAYNNLGIIFYNKGNLDKSIQLFENTIELNPQFAEAYTNLGIAYGNKGNLDKTVQLFIKAANLDDKKAQEWLKNNNIKWSK